MKKLVSAFEEKNKIIEEIQKNLRKPSQMSSTRYQHQTLHFDLPSINGSSSIHKKESLQSSSKTNQHLFQSKQLFETKKGPFSPWIQTLSFNSEQLVANENILLLKHRSTMKNFQKTNVQQFPQSHKSFDCSGEKDPGICPKKIVPMIKSEKKSKNRIFVEEDREQSRSKHNSDCLSVYERLSRKNDSFKLGKISMAKFEERKLGVKELNLSNSRNLDKNRRRKGLEKKSETYSPWTSEYSEEINQIWSTGRKSERVHYP